MKMLITLEHYGIFESNFSNLFILIVSSHHGMQNGDKGWPRVIFGCSRYFSENAHNS